uniref:Secreted protein n=1 Tax=Globodera pallida TaxID=36090 RepID=A0A183BY02_GLOPA
MFLFSVRGAGHMVPQKKGFELLHLLVPTRSSGAAEDELDETKNVAPFVQFAPLDVATNANGGHPTMEMSIF